MVVILTVDTVGISSVSYTLFQNHKQALTDRPRLVTPDQEEVSLTFYIIRLK